MIVNSWPTTIETADGIICNPTPEQCKQAGYELAIPLTAEEIAQIESQATQVESERIAAIESLRQDYRDAVAQFCTVAGVPVVTKFAGASDMKTIILKVNAGGDLQQIIGLGQLTDAIQNAITELRRKDGDDAWDRI